MKMKIVKSIFAVVLLAVVSVIVILISIIPAQTKYANVKIDGVSVRAELADSMQKKVSGLMFRDSIGENEGMLFIFGAEGSQGFWMMNVKIPLDIIWIDSKMKVVHVEKNLQPCLTSCSIYKPPAPAQYVLEVSGGFSDKNNIGIGSVAEVYY